MAALRKVLVVDDDMVVTKSFDRVLTQKGYLVVSARDAHEALERVRAEDVDVVFTDIRMPGMDGLELAEKLKQRRPWTPVVIVTGYGTPAAEERAYAAGVSAFLHKPLSPQMIEDSTTSALMHAPRAAEAAVAEAPAAPVAGRAVTAEPAPAAEAAAPGAAEPATRGSRAKDIALFFAAPFIGLAYAVLLPVVGLAMLAWIGAQALAERPAVAKRLPTLRYVATGVAAPFIGLAFVIALPIAGAAALAWTVAQAAVRRSPQ
jgi:CheY-like chemotaxis protein